MARNTNSTYGGGSTKTYGMSKTSTPRVTTGKSKTSTPRVTTGMSKTSMPINRKGSK